MSITVAVALAAAVEAAAAATGKEASWFISICCGQSEMILGNKIDRFV